MRKTLRIGTVQQGGRRASVYISVKFRDDKLSITGVIGPLPSGGALGGCGQIDMEFAHRNPEHNDKRYCSPIRSKDINFASAWTPKKWLDLLDVWKEYHLNDMQAACEHQRELGWTYEAHHNPKTFKGEDCPVCGYSIGSKWLSKTIPTHVITFLANLPDTDKTPAWV